MRRGLLLLALAWSAISTAGAQATLPSGWQVLYQQDFEHGPPPEWGLAATAGPGTGWSLKTEPGNTYLSAAGHVTAYLNLGPWADFSFKGRVRLIGDGVTLNFRTSGCSRYLVPFNVENVQIGVTRPDCATGPMLKTVPENYSLNTWYSFQIVGIGSTIDVYINGALQFEYLDPTPILIGSVTLECITQADFDDIKISGPPPPVIQPWVRTGGPLGGTGYDIKMRPDNPDVMYVTDISSGVHITSDGGRTWTPTNQGITTRSGPSGDAVPIFCAAIDANNPDIVWVGTFGAGGPFKSVDGGKTWVPKTNGIVESTGITFRGITVDPHNSNVVYAAGEVSSFVWAGESKTGLDFDLTRGFVYRSTNGGDNWTAIWRGDNLARYVVIDPSDSQTIYVSTGIFDREAANSDLRHGIAGGVGIVKSADGGHTWRILNEANGLTNLYVGSLKMSPANPKVLLAGAGLVGDPDPGGIFLSTDGGEHWKQATDASGSLIHDKFNAVAFAPSNPQILYAAGYNLFYRSADGGVTWRLLQGGDGVADDRGQLWTARHPVWAAD